jgi:hypothetical protein
MENFETWNVLYYVLFLTFINYQQKHYQNFRGHSVVGEFILGLYAYGGMIVALTFLVYYGFTVEWWAPFVLFLMGIIGMSIMVLVQQIIGLEILSILGFIIVPITGYLMFDTIPNS